MTTAVACISDQNQANNRLHGALQSANNTCATNQTSSSATADCGVKVRKVHCAVVDSCYNNRPALHRTCLCREVGIFRRGCVTFAEYFTGKGTSPTNHCWCQKTRMIAFSWGIKISAVHHLVLSQYTHLTDTRTDGRTDRISTAIPCVALHGVAR